MNRTMKRIAGKIAEQQGFTLIEMAIVLIIIGIIIGAVVKGKDVVKSAEQKRLYTTYVRAWQVAFNNYYDRTGWILGDSNDPANAGTRDGHCGDNVNYTTLASQLSNVGLEAPPPGQLANGLQRTYTDSLGVTRTLTLAFDYKNNVGNIIRVTGISSDIGMAWDRLVDGERDGTAGDFLHTANHGPNPIVLSAWPAADDSGNQGGAHSAVLRLEF